MRRALLVGLVGLICLSPTASFALDRVVNPLISQGDGVTVFPTIEQAFAACEEGDRVLIKVGVYEEQALSVGVGITLMPFEEVGNVIIRSNVTMTSLASSLIRFERIRTEEYSISIAGSGNDFTLEFEDSQTTTLTLNHEGDNQTTMVTGSDFLALNLNGSGDSKRVDVTHSTASGSCVVSGNGNSRDSNVWDCTIGTLRCSGNGSENHFTSYRNDLGTFLVEGNGSTVEETRCQAHVKDCTITGDCSVNINGWDLEMVRTSVSGTTSFRYGNLVQCPLGNVELNDEEGTATETHRHSIIQNTMNNLTLSNDNAHFRVANNALNGLTVNNLRGDLTRHNDIVNNEFGGSNSVSFLSNPSQWNVRFVNNTFSGNPSLGSFPNASVAGSFEWSYNTHGLPFVDTGSGDPLVYNERENNADQVDAGHPGHEFYDPDGTLNDKGRAGGPFGSANFPDGTGLDAAVFDLELPSDFYQGISVPVEVKTHH